MVERITILSRHGDPLGKEAVDVYPLKLLFLAF
jgi:hypothetical protein